MGSPDAKKYWAGTTGWQSGMYDRLFRLPPHEVGELQCKTDAIIVSGLAKGSYYLSVMAVDQYGESVGKQLYPLSNEVKVEIS